MTEQGLLDRKILIIDDEETIRFLLKEMLLKLGYESDEAANKESAVHMLESSTYDLVFVDMVYINADYDGFDIINIIQEVQPRCQVVILTAKPSMNSAIQALRQRIFDYLEKPICIEVLSAVTTAAFESSRKEDTSIQPTTDIALTNREIDILKMLAKGFSYAEVGKHLDCKTSTIQWHIKNIYRKLGVTSKSEAVYEALCMNLIDIN